VLAVDNFNNSEVCGRSIRVDHVKKYRPPREYLEVKDDDDDFFNKMYKPSGPDGKGWGEYRVMDEEEKIALKKAEEIDKRKLSQSERLLDSMKNLKSAAAIDEDERVRDFFFF
jgi:RNA-binding motif X-linked protein 2